MTFMKKSLLIGALALLSGLTAFGQGAVVFANNSSSRVYIDTVGTGTTGAVPVGSTYTVELMYAPDGTPDIAFDAVATRVGNTAVFGPTVGQFSGGNRTVTSISPAGGFGMFQVRAWETAFGASYAETVLNPNAQGRARAGHSGIYRVDTDDPADPNPPTPLVNYLQPFAVTIVPEPSVIGLGLLGAGTLLLLRRRK